MSGLQIFLYVLLAILIFYLAFFVYVLHCAISFRSKMDKGLMALGILYSEKREVLLSLCDLVEPRMGEPSSSLNRERLAVEALKFDKIKEKDAESAALFIGAFQKRLTMLALGASSDASLDEKELERHFAALKDLDTNARRLISVYNAEVIAYEYWRKLWPYYLLLLIFGFRKRNRLT